MRAITTLTATGTVTVTVTVTVTATVATKQQPLQPTLQIHE